MMGSFSGEVWLILAGLGVAAVAAMFYTLACRARNEMQLHDLRLAVIALRQEYMQRLEQTRAGKRRPGDAAPQPAPEIDAGPAPIPAPDAAEAEPQRRAA